MCGIGLIFSREKSRNHREQVARQMLDTLKHRGPDAQDLWSNDLGLTLLHTRLAIVDLSPMGAQPICSSSGRWTMVFNGEIYNHPEIRAQYLSHHSFRGHSDSETLVELFELLGPEEAIKKARGMFAIAAYSRDNNELFLCRDRIGEKPLYYGQIGNDFVVGSELKSIMCHPEFSKDLDFASLELFLKFNHVPQPHSIFKNIKKLPQASLLRVSLNPLRIENPKDYWTLPLSQSSSHLDPHWKENIESKLKEVVGLQMRSDVPYGCFLSGGIDSSTIAALMQSQSNQPIKTFSIGFDNSEFNEAPYAKQIAQHLGTDHSEWILSSQDAKAVIPNLPTIYDEPFADSSQIPTFLLSKMTRQKVTVCLSGDGGDELFAGYNRYYWTTKLWKIIGWLPLPMRKTLSKLIAALPASGVAFIYRALAPLIPGQLRVAQVEAKIEKLITILKADSARSLFYRTLTYWPEPEKVMLNPIPLIDLNMTQHRDLDIRAYMLWHDQRNYLPDDIMVKVDRASMANSLETRAPFLDHELIEYVASLPLSMRATTTPKQLLRNVLYKYVPPSLIERPKMGFAIPLKEWLKFDLKELTLDLLSEEQLRRQNIFQPQMVSQILRDFYEGNKAHQDLIWLLLSFQLWHGQWIKK